MGNTEITRTDGAQIPAKNEKGAPPEVQKNAERPWSAKQELGRLAETILKNSDENHPVSTIVLNVFDTWLANGDEDKMQKASQLKARAAQIAEMYDPEKGAALRAKILEKAKSEKASELKVAIQAAEAIAQDPKKLQKYHETYKEIALGLEKKLQEFARENPEAPEAKTQSPLEQMQSRFEASTGVRAETLQEIQTPDAKRDALFALQQYTGNREELIKNLDEVRNVSDPDNAKKIQPFLDKLQKMTPDELQETAVLARQIAFESSFADKNKETELERAQRAFKDETGIDAETLKSIPLGDGASNVFRELHLYSGSGESLSQAIEKAVAKNIPKIAQAELQSFLEKIKGMTPAQVEKIRSLALRVMLESPMQENQQEVVAEAEPEPKAEASYDANALEKLQQVRKQLSKEALNEMEAAEKNKDESGLGNIKIMDAFAMPLGKTAAELPKYLFQKFPKLFQMLESTSTRSEMHEEFLRNEDAIYTAMEAINDGPTLQKLADKLKTARTIDGLIQSDFEDVYNGIRTKINDDPVLSKEWPLGKGLPRNQDGLMDVLQNKIAEIESQEWRESDSNTLAQHEATKESLKRLLIDAKQPTLDNLRTLIRTKDLQKFLANESENSTPREKTELMIGAKGIPEGSAQAKQPLEKTAPFFRTKGMQEENTQARRPIEKTQT